MVAAAMMETDVIRVLLMAMVLVAAPVWGSFAMAHPRAVPDLHCPDHHEADVPVSRTALPVSPPLDCQLACLVLGAAPTLDVRAQIGPLPRRGLALSLPPRDVSPDLLSWPPPLKPPRS